MREFDGIRVKVVATSQCNVRCKHCYIGYTGKRSAEELMEISDNLLKKYEVRFDGSELLTDMDYLPVFKHVGQTYVCSNGKIFTEKIDSLMNHLKNNGVVNIYLSYHMGMQAQYSQIKAEDLDRIIPILIENGFFVGLMSTFSKRNINMLVAFVEKARELKVEVAQVNPLIIQGRAKYSNFMNDILSQKDRQYILAECERLSSIYSDLKIEPGKAFEEWNPGITHCKSVTRKVWLGLDNKIYPCVFLIDPKYAIGEYINEKIMIYDDVCWNSTRCSAMAYSNRGEEVNIRK